MGICIVPKSVVITSETSCDLLPPLDAEFQIHCLPLYVSIPGGKSGRDGVEVFPGDIYAANAERKVYPKTAAAPLGEYIAFFEQFTAQGYDVVHLALSSVVSSCAHVAAMAAEECHGHVFVVDSKNFCLGGGMLCIQAAKLRDQGYGAADLVSEIERLRAKVRTWYLVDKLDFLAAGGRVNQLIGGAAALLQLHPLLTTNGETGEVNVGKKYRGKVPAVQEAFLRDAIAAAIPIMDNKLVFFARTPDVPNDTIDPLNALARELLPGVERVETGTVGCMVASHCGRNCYALVAMEK
jgi:DegV family protein with EDD domain